MALSQILDLKKTNEIWLLLVRRIRGYVDDEGRAIRPYVLYLYEIAPSTIMRGKKILLKGKTGKYPSEDSALKLLTTAMNKHVEILNQPPHRPSTIIFTSKKLYDKLSRIITELGMLCKLWTEEENQSFGDDQLYEFSDQLIKEQNFGCSKGAKKPGLLSIRGVTPSFCHHLFDGAKQLFNSNAWQLTKEGQAFVISYNNKEVRLFTLLGHESEYSILMESLWVQMHSLLTIRRKSPFPLSSNDNNDNNNNNNNSSSHYCTTIFTSEEGIPFEDLEAAEQYNWPLPIGKLGTAAQLKVDIKSRLYESFPLPICFPDVPPKIEDSFRPNRKELQWFEIAYKSIATFINNGHIQNSEKQTTFYETSFNINTYDGKAQIKIAFCSDSQQYESFHTYVNQLINEANALNCIQCSKKENLTNNIILKRCSRCQQKLYCSRECQVANWPTHKSICKPPPPKPTSTTTTSTSTTSTTPSTSTTSTSTPSITTTKIDNTNENSTTTSTPSITTTKTDDTNENSTTTATITTRTEDTVD
eukprot:TRINITY_DN737_c0_g1_i1.p1 TRINITY_DN737_c0_g1~~TRINITY_DN737_c0_g1_i1.p1  ORF type:complete len:530 (-),score=269.85 TRINITY_DN737_c0_g1_i1:101-1690(-)